MVGYICTMNMVEVGAFGSVLKQQHRSDEHDEYTHILTHIGVSEWRNDDLKECLIKLWPLTPPASVHTTSSWMAVIQRIFHQDRFCNNSFEPSYQYPPTYTHPGRQVRWLSSFLFVIFYFDIFDNWSTKRYSSSRMVSALWELNWRVGFGMNPVLVVVLQIIKKLPTTMITVGWFRIPIDKVGSI